MFSSSKSRCQYRAKTKPDNKLAGVELCVVPLNLNFTVEFLQYIGHFSTLGQFHKRRAVKLVITNQRKFSNVNEL